MKWGEGELIYKMQRREDEVCGRYWLMDCSARAGCGGSQQVNVGQPYAEVHVDLFLVAWQFTDLHNTFSFNFTNNFLIVKSHTSICTLRKQEG